MANAPLRRVVQTMLAGLARADGGDDDALLERFVAWRDESAFELLVYRHGPMVRGVCRRLVGCEHDAEDAFQATFLALARQAHRVRSSRSLSGWLYRVAWHAALKARARTKSAGWSTEPAIESDPARDLLDSEIRAVLDEEIMRLPERFRLPVVLCCLQGKSNREAALALGCPTGTVDSRLATARGRLKARLLRRGFAPAAGLALERTLTTAAAAAELSPSLVRPVVQAALAFLSHNSAAVPISAAALANGVLQTMYLTKLKWTALVLLTLGLVGSGAGVASYQAFADGPQTKETAKAPPTADKAIAIAKPAGPATTREIRKLLRQPAEIENPIDDVPLKEVLQMLSERYRVTIRIDPTAFKKYYVEKPLELYEQQVKLPVTRGLTIGEILSDILSQVRMPETALWFLSATFVARGNQIVIVPGFMTPFARTSEVPILSPDLIEEQILGEPVSIDVHDKPLGELLDELADRTGANIVLDVREKEKSKTPITVTLQQVRLYKALQVIADMADLQPAALHNVYYVTEPTNAERLEKLERPQTDPPAPPAVPPSKPGRK